MHALESSPRSRTGDFSLRPDAPTSSREDDPRWQLAERIAASSSLGRSRLMVDFLLYVVDRHIHNRSDEITEQQIGVLVFGRPEGYDTNEDNIVRSYARNLRKRIEEYFVKEGKGEELLLQIPRGGYTPVFSPGHRKQISDVAQLEVPRDLQFIENVETVDIPDLADSMITEQEPTTQELTVEESEATGTNETLGFARLVRKYAAVLLLIAGFLLGSLFTVFFPPIWLKRLTASPAEIASKDLWAQLFSSKRDTFVVPSDDGLVIMQRLTERPVPLASYLDGSYRTKIQTVGDSDAAEIMKLGSRRYTSVVDLDLASHLGQLSEVNPQRMIVRYARDLRMDDLRDGNAILIGSIEANPWTELFQAHMNFRFSIHADNEKPSGIVNVHPRPGEEPIYGAPGVQNHTYGLIAYLPNLNATGHVLIVEGLNTAGTQAAETFLLTPSLLEPTLRRARLPSGGFQPFEVLIGAGNVASNAAAPQMVLERIGSF